MQRTAQNDNPLFTQVEPELSARTSAKTEQLDNLRQAITTLEKSSTHDLIKTEHPSEHTVAIETQNLPSGHSHEVWAARPSDYSAVMGYALQTMTRSEKPILWITTNLMIREHGMPYGPGLLAHHIDPQKLIFVRCDREQHVLWAMEEGLKSQALAAVVGELTDISLTNSRRLSLACREHGACSITLLQRNKAASTACYSRWKIEPAVSNSTIFAKHAPGPMRLKASLVKHRAGTRPSSNIMEWQNAQNRLPMATTLADRTLDAHEQSNSATG